MDSLKASLNNICRLCLAKVPDPSTMQSLEDEGADTIWTTSVRSFTLKKPMHNEDLPNKMCGYCAVWITKLIHFKLQCQVSERLLTSLLKYYKGEAEKASAVIRVCEQQWNVPVFDSSEILSKYENHLNRLHKAVQVTVTHLDRRAGEGQPILPYRTVNTVQFYLTFIQHLLMSVNSIASSDNQDVVRSFLPALNKQQPWENCMPNWAQEILNQSCGQLWDRFIQATLTEAGSSKQNKQSSAPSVQPQTEKSTSSLSVEQMKESSDFPLLQSVLNGNKKDQNDNRPLKSGTESETSQAAAEAALSLQSVINLENSGGETHSKKNLSPLEPSMSKESKQPIKFPEKVQDLKCSKNRASQTQLSARSSMERSQEMIQRLLGQRPENIHTAHASTEVLDGKRDSNVHSKNFPSADQSSNTTEGEREPKQLELLLVSQKLPLQIPKQTRNMQDSTPNGSDSEHAKNHSQKSVDILTRQKSQSQELPEKSPEHQRVKNHSEDLLRASGDSQNSTENLLNLKASVSQKSTKQGAELNSQSEKVLSLQELKNQNSESEIPVSQTAKLAEKSVELQKSKCGHSSIRQKVEPANSAQAVSGQGQVRSPESQDLVVQAPKLVNPPVMQKLAENAPELQKSAKEHKTPGILHSQAAESSSSSKKLAKPMPDAREPAASKLVNTSVMQKLAENAPESQKSTKELKAPGVLQSQATESSSSSKKLAKPMPDAGEPEASKLVNTSVMQKLVENAPASQKSAKEPSEQGILQSQATESFCSSKKSVGSKELAKPLPEPAKIIQGSQQDKAGKSQELAKYTFSIELQMLAKKVTEHPEPAMSKELQEQVDQSLESQKQAGETPGSQEQARKILKSQEAAKKEQEQLTNERESQKLSSSIVVPLKETKKSSQPQKEDKRTESQTSEKQDQIGLKPLSSQQISELPSKATELQMSANEGKKTEPLKATSAMVAVPSSSQNIMEPQLNPLSPQQMSKLPSKATELQTSANEKKVEPLEATPAMVAVPSSSQNTMKLQEGASQEDVTKQVKKPRLQENDKEKIFDLIVKQAISRAYEREKVTASHLRRRERRVHSSENLASTELFKNIEVNIGGEQSSEDTESKSSRPSSAPNAGVFEVLPPLIPIPKNNAPNFVSGLVNIPKAKCKNTNSGNGKEITSGVSNNKVSAETTIPSSLTNDKEKSIKEPECLVVNEIQKRNVVQLNPESIVRNKTPVDKEPAVQGTVPRSTISGIRVRQDLATDPATRPSNNQYFPKNLQIDNSNSAPQNQQQNRVSTSDSLQSCTVSSTLAMTESQMNPVNTAAIPQQRTNQLGVSTSKSMPFNVTTAHQMGLPFVRCPNVTVPISSHQQMHPLISTPASQPQWMVGQPPPYQLGIVGAMPQNQAVPSIPAANISQTLPVSVITTVFQNHPPLQPFPQSVTGSFNSNQAPQIGANTLTSDVPVEPTSASENSQSKDAATVSKLYQQHLGIDVPESEHFKEPWISWLVSKLQSRQHEDHSTTAQSSLAATGQPQQKDGVARISGNGQKPSQEQRNNLTAVNTQASEPQMTQRKVSAPVSHQNTLYSPNVPVSQPTLQQHVQPVFQFQGSQSDISRMAVMQQQGKPKVIAMPVTPQGNRLIAQQLIQPRYTVPRPQHIPQAPRPSAPVSQHPVQSTITMPVSQLQKLHTVVTSVSQPVQQPRSNIVVSTHQMVQPVSQHGVQSKSNLAVSQHQNIQPLFQQGVQSRNDVPVSSHQKVHIGISATVPQQAMQSRSNVGVSTSQMVQPVLQEAVHSRGNTPVPSHQKVQTGISATVPQQAVQSRSNVGVSKAQMVQPVSQEAVHSRGNTPVSSHQKIQTGISPIVPQQAVQSRSNVVSKPQMVQPISQEAVHSRGNTPVSSHQKIQTGISPIVPQQAVQSRSNVVSKPQMVQPISQEAVHSRGNTPVSSHQKVHTGIGSTVPQQAVQSTSNVAVSQHQKAHSEGILSQHVVQSRSNLAVSQNQKVQAGVGTSVSQQAMHSRCNVPVSQQQMVQPGIGTKTVQQAGHSSSGTAVSQHQKIQAAASATVPQQAIPSKSVAVSQHQKVQAGVSTSASQQAMHSRYSVPVSPQQMVQQGIGTKTVQQAVQSSSNPAVSQHQKIQAATSATVAQQAIPSNSVAVSQHQKGQTGVGPSVSQQVMQSRNNIPVSQHQNLPGASAAISEKGVKSKHRVAILQKVKQSRNDTGVLETLTMQPRNSISLSRQHIRPTLNVTAPQVGNIIMLDQQHTAHPHKSYQPAGQVDKAGTAAVSMSPSNQISRAADSTSKGINKLQSINLTTQCNTSTLSGVMQPSQLVSGPSTSVTSHLTGDKEIISKTKQTMSLENEMVVDRSAVHSPFANSEQPGISALPEVIRAIGSELGVFMEEDAMEPSVSNVTAWRAAISLSIPEHPNRHLMQKSMPLLEKSARSSTSLAQALVLNLISLMRTHTKESLGVSEERWQRLQAAILNSVTFRRSNWKVRIQPDIKIRRYSNKRKLEQGKETTMGAVEQHPEKNESNASMSHSDGMSLLAGSSNATELDVNSSTAQKLHEFRIKITKNNGKYESNPVHHNPKQQELFASDFDTDSSDSWELYVPRAAKRRRIIYDDDDDEEEEEEEEEEVEVIDDQVKKPSIKVSQLQAYQLAPYVSVTKLIPEFFKPGYLYNLKDEKVAALAQRLSNVVRNPGTIGRNVKEELQ